MNTERFKARILKLLEDHDDARILFEKETKFLEVEIQNKCSTSFLTGAIFSAIVMSISIIYLLQNKQELLYFIIDRVG